MSKLIECPSCKNKISINDTSCTKCGQPITDEIKNTASKKKKNKFGCLILIVIIFICSLFFNKDDDKKNIPVESSKQNSQNTNSKEIFKLEYNSSLKCPNFLGLYLGMDEDSATQILNDIVKKYNLSSKVVRTSENLIDMGIIYPNFINDKKHNYGRLITVSTYDGDRIDGLRGKVIRIFVYPLFFSIIGYSQDNLLNDFVKECTPGTGINKSTIIEEVKKYGRADLNNGYIGVIPLHDQGNNQDRFEFRLDYYSIFMKINASK